MRTSGESRGGVRSRKTGVLIWERRGSTKSGSNYLSTKTFRILFWPESWEQTVNSLLLPSSAQTNENERDPNPQHGMSCLQKSSKVNRRKRCVPLPYENDSCCLVIYRNNNDLIWWSLHRKMYSYWCFLRWKGQWQDGVWNKV